MNARNISIDIQFVRQHKANKTIVFVKLIKRFTDIITSKLQYR